MGNCHEFLAFEFITYWWATRPIEGFGPSSELCTVVHTFGKVSLGIRHKLEEAYVFSTRFSYFTLVNKKTIYLEAVIGETDFEYAVVGYQVPKL